MPNTPLQRSPVSQMATSHIRGQTEKTADTESGESIASMANEVQRERRREAALKLECSRAHLPFFVRPRASLNSDLRLGRKT
jgi:hypothetical protein